MQCRASGSTMRALVDYFTPYFTLQPAEYHAPGLKARLSHSISRNTSAWRAPPLQRLHVGTHSRPIIQQDRSSEAIVSAISQLHLLSVLLAILKSSGLRGPASNRINPAGQLRLQYRNCTCCSSCWRSSIVAAARLNIHQNQSSKASVSALSHWHLLLVLMAFSLPFWRSSFTNPPPHLPWLRRP